MLVVLVLLSVMLLGGLALTRLTEIGTLASGNAAYHEAALQASEIGINNAYVAVRGLTAEDTSISSWYSATALVKDSNGLPSGVNWTAAPETVVGSSSGLQFSVRYVAERACTTTPVTNVLRQCLVKQDPDPMHSRSGGPLLDPVNSKQFRITVRVTGPKGTLTWVQSLVTKG